MARDALPHLEQVFFHSDEGLQGDDLEERLYQLRRSFQADITEASKAEQEEAEVEEAAGSSGLSSTYVASLSSRTIVYKGMVQSVVLPRFYKDLTNPLYQSHFAIYHRRFSTNTVPRWPLAQPMRCLGHNGEINTLLGNVNWQRALDQQRQRSDPLCSLDRYFLELVLFRLDV